MSAYPTRRRIRGALLTCVAALAIAVPAANAGIQQPATASPGSPTSDADIDAVPGLRAQLDRQAAASPTSDADIDAVPGLRAQLNRQTEAAADRPHVATTRVARGTTDADIDAVPGLREQLNRQAAAATPAVDATDDFQWGDAALGAAGAVGLLAVIAASAFAAGAVRRRGGGSPGVA